MLKVTADVIGMFAFGYDLGGRKVDNPEDAPLFHAFEIVLDTFTQRGIDITRDISFKLGLPTEFNKTFHKQMKILDDAVEKMIEKRLSEIDKGIEKNDLLNQLLSKDDNGAFQLSMKDVTDNVKTFLFAGHDTTASSIAWTIYLVTKNSNVYQSLMDEIDEYLEDQSPFLYDTLEKMNYLNAVVKESLRLYPSAAFSRRFTCQTEVAGHTFPAGMEIMFIPQLIHLSDKYWKNPLEFRPERWLKGEVENINQAAYLPFSSGPRNCVGSKLALLEIRVIICRLLQEFKLTFVGEKSPYVLLKMTFTPFDLWFTAEPRSPKNREIKQAKNNNEEEIKKEHHQEHEKEQEKEILEIRKPDIDKGEKYLREEELKKEEELKQQTREEETNFRNGNHPKQDKKEEIRKGIQRENEVENKKDVQKEIQKEIQRENDEENHREIPREIQKENMKEIQKEIEKEIQKEIEKEIQRENKKEIQREAAVKKEEEQKIEIPVPLEYSMLIAGTAALLSLIFKN